MFSDILNVFAEATPIAVIVRGLLERFLNPAVIDEWFESVRGRQYTKQILFSSILGIMLQVVCRVKKNVNVAYRDSDIGASVVAVYDKLKKYRIKNIARACALCCASGQRCHSGNRWLRPGIVTRLPY
jgi:hypothetical protein